MSEGMNHKWKQKREKQRGAKPYERPKKESFVTTLASKAKDNWLIPNWLKSVADYLIPSTTAEDNEVEANSHEVVGCSSEPGVSSFGLRNEVSEINASNKSEDIRNKASRAALNDPTATESAVTEVPAFTDNRINEQMVDDEGSSTTSNTASSTSGCSSLVPSHQDHMLQRLNFPIGKNSLETLRKELMKKTRDVVIETESKQRNDNNVTTSNQSFSWSAGTKRKAEFNVSKFFSPSSVIPLQNKSPFYEGRTSFGGASSKRMRLAGSPYVIGTQKIPSVVRVKVNESRNVESNLSSTARRILASMEKFSSPLEDAKKLPSYKESVSDCIINPIKPFRKFVAGKPSTTLTFSPFEPLLTNTGNQEKNTSTNQSIKSVCAFDVKDNSEKTASAGGGKMRTKVTKLTRREIKPVEDDVSATVLPNAPLTVMSLPSFTFGKAKETEAKPSSNVKSKPTTTVMRILDVGEDNSKENMSEFKFTTPLLPNKSLKTPDDLVESPMKFSKPIDAQRNAERNSIFEKDMKQLHCNNKQETSIGGSCLKPAFNSVGTKLELASKRENIIGLLTKYWSCPTCMIQNPVDKLKCAACEACKPGTETTESIASTKNFVGSERNDLKVSKELNSKENKESEFKSVNNAANVNSGWGSKFAPPSNTWECDTCLVRNKAAESKCVACETPKPGSKPDNSFKQVYSGYTFGNLDTSNKTPVFKFGIPQDKNNSDLSEKKDVSSPKKVTFNIQSEGGFAEFSKTSPTFSITTSSTTSNTTTTNSGLNIGLLSSPKLDEKANDVQKLTPISQGKAYMAKNITVNAEKNIFDVQSADSTSSVNLFKTQSNDVNLTPVSQGKAYMAKNITVNAEKNIFDVKSADSTSSVNLFKTQSNDVKEIKSQTSAPSLFCFGGTSSTPKPSEFTKKVEENTSDNGAKGNSLFAKPNASQPISFVSSKATNSTSFIDLINEKKDNVESEHKNSDPGKGFVFGRKMEPNSVSFSIQPVTTSTSSLFSAPNQQSAFKLPFGSTPLNTSGQSTANSESTSISSTTTVASSPSFTFGNSATKLKAESAFTPESTTQTSTNPSSGGFKFSFSPKSPLNASGFTAPTVPNPVALQPTTTTTQAPTTTITPSSKLFPFGSSLNAGKGINANPPFGSISQPLSATTTASVAPTFSFSEKSPSNFTFAAPAPKNPVQPQPSTATGGFSFGQTQSQQPQNFAPTTTPFVFGSQPVNTSINTASQGFNFNNANTIAPDFKTPSFGQNTTPALQFPFGQSNPTPTNALSFGAPAAQPSATPLMPQAINFSQTPNFNFGQTTGQPGSVFQFAANASESSINSGLSTTRSIKKAKRRLGGPP